MYTPDPPSYGSAPYNAPPPAWSGSPPPVWTWFRVYAGAMTLMYVVLLGVGVFMLLAGSTVAESSRNPEDAFMIPILGGVYAGLGLVFAVAYAVGLLMPRKPWAWIYGIVLIAIGMTSACCIPATIPLLIFWIKPEAKAFFGRS
jgi:hypothetical protein